MAKVTVVQQLQAQLDAVRFGKWVQGQPHGVGEACLIIRVPLTSDTSILHNDIYEEDGEQLCVECDCAIGQCRCAECGDCCETCGIGLTEELGPTAQNWILRALKKTAKFQGWLSTSYTVDTSVTLMNYNDSEADEEDIVEALDEALRYAKEDADRRKK